MSKVIEVKKLNFGYNGKAILKDVTFDINKGDFIGIIGPNGSGKSTLVKLLLGLLEPDNGGIKLFKQDIKEFKSWDKLSYVSQKANAFNTSFPATVGEVVGANLYSKVGLFKRIKNEHENVIDDALDIVGMKEYKNNLIGNLSGGQQQRVFIARAIVNNPQVIFLDEPTVGVDAKAEEIVYCLLADLNKSRDITIIIVTHDISAVTVHANKIACISNNKINIHNTKELADQKFLTDLYGYDVNIHAHNHTCQNCMRGAKHNA